MRAMPDNQISEPSTHQQPPSRLATALAIHQWLQEDMVTPYAQRRQRDEAIGETLQRTRPDADDVQLVLAWWQTRNPPEALTRRIDSGHYWISLTLIIIGLLCGSSATSVALTYSGDYPVNLLPLLGVLVGLPGLLLLASIAALVISRIGGGRLIRPLRIYQRAVLGWFERWTGLYSQGFAGRHILYGQVGAWLLQRLSQRAAVAYFAACLTTAWLLIAFSDIAFGWSSTLDISADQVHAWTTAITSPWAWMTSTGVPDLAQVEQARYFRLGEQFDGVDVRQFGQWWPFVLLCIGVWGLGPRLIMLIIARWRLGQATDELLLEHSEVTALLDRLRAPRVRYDGASTGVQPNTAPEPIAEEAAEPGAVLVSWNQADQNVHCIQMAAGDTPEERTGALQQIARDVHQVRVMAKGWEPPVFELLDALQDIRARVGAVCSIVVIPLGLDQAPLDDHDLRIWRQSLARSGDAHLYVMPDDAEHN